MSKRSIVWFRSDLRTHDHPALHAACAASPPDLSQPVVGVFLIAYEQWREHDWSHARVDLLRRTLEKLSDGLAGLNIPLKIVVAASFDEAPKALLKTAQAVGAGSVYYHHEYELNERQRDDAAVDVLAEHGIAAHGFHDQVMLEPGEVRTQGDGTYYTVYSPFRRRWTEVMLETGLDRLTPLPKPKSVKGGDEVQSDPVPESIHGFEATPEVREQWPAGEGAALERLEGFKRADLEGYKENRDSYLDDRTSRLSPYLANGSISTRLCFHTCLIANDGKLFKGKSPSGGVEVWLSELLWREFYRHIMVGFPRVCMHRPFKANYDAVEWRDDDEGFAAWCEGRTGYPIVDAAMRCLNETAWMHNRLRMVVAMFLSKHLLIDWRRGERYFMRTLIDGDLGSNNGGWQWSSSTGTDAQPYFRIFNPVTQSERFDPDGEFLRKYIPEIAHFEGKAIHDPPSDERDGLHGSYPSRIVEHKAARLRALEAFKNAGDESAAAAIEEES